MQIRYDPKYNIAYLSFREKTEQVETIALSDEMNVDIAPDGTVYGIELLNANEQLLGDDGHIIVHSEALGQISDVQLVC